MRNDLGLKRIGYLNAESPTHNLSGADHALASLRESNLTLAIMSHASALAIVASKSFARRRLRLSPAMVRKLVYRYFLRVLSFLRTLFPLESTTRLSRERDDFR